MSFIDTAKQWFLTGLKPTQAQFHQVFEWLRWKDEKISYNDLDDYLKSVLNLLAKPVQVANLNAPGVIVMPADAEVFMITLKSELGGDIISYYKVGFHVDGDPDTYLDKDLAIESNKIYHSQIAFDVLAGQEIYFEGINNLTQIKIYKM